MNAVSHHTKRFFEEHVMDGLHQGFVGVVEFSQLGSERIAKENELKHQITKLARETRDFQKLIAKELDGLVPRADFITLQTQAARKDDLNSMRDKLKACFKTEEVQKPFLQMKAQLDKIQARMTEKLVEKQEVMRLESTIRKWGSDSFAPKNTFHLHLQAFDKHLERVDATETALDEVSVQLENMLAEVTRELADKAGAA